MKMERKNAIALRVSQEIRTNLPELKLKKVKECQWEVIPTNHQNAPLNLYLFPLNFFKKVFRKMAMQEFL